MTSIQLLCRAVEDVEVRYIPSGTAVASTRVASNRTYKSSNGETKEDTVFVDVVFWGKQAEVAGQYVTKGKQLYITGHLQQDTWEDKETGARRSKLRVVVDSYQFLGGNGKNTSPSTKETKAEVVPANEGVEEEVPF